MDWFNIFCYHCVINHLYGNTNYCNEKSCTKSIGQFVLISYVL